MANKVQAGLLAFAIAICVAILAALIVAFYLPREEQQAAAPSKPWPSPRQTTQALSADTTPDYVPPDPSPPIPPVHDPSGAAVPLKAAPRPVTGLPATAQAIPTAEVEEPIIGVPGHLLKEIVPGYETREIDGFRKVLLSTLAIKQAKELRGKPFKALVTEFDGLVAVLSPKTLRAAQRVVFWIEWDNTNKADPDVLAKYYGGNLWGEPIDRMKSDGIELLSLKTLSEIKESSVERSQLILLHEISHAVHRLVLPGGYGNQGVRFAYRQAMDRRLYDNVQNSDGGIGRAYAATNEFEYFAELSCAYLDRCRWFPFTRADLKEHDPTGYRLMESCWGVLHARPAVQSPPESRNYVKSAQNDASRGNASRKQGQHPTVLAAIDYLRTLNAGVLIIETTKLGGRKVRDRVSNQDALVEATVVRIKYRDSNGTHDDFFAVSGGTAFTPECQVLYRVPYDKATEMMPDFTEPHR
jgi:hypothetical protein